MIIDSDDEEDEMAGEGQGRSGGRRGELRGTEGEEIEVWKAPRVLEKRGMVSQRINPKPSRMK